MRVRARVCVRVYVWPWLLLCIHNLSCPVVLTYLGQVCSFVFYTDRETVERRNDILQNEHPLLGKFQWNIMVYLCFIFSYILYYLVMLS